MWEKLENNITLGLITLRFYAKLGNSIKSTSKTLRTLNYSGKKIKKWNKRVVAQWSYLSTEPWRLMGTKLKAPQNLWYLWYLKRNHSKNYQDTVYQILMHYWTRDSCIHPLCSIHPLRTLWRENWWVAAYRKKG